MIYLLHGPDTFRSWHKLLDIKHKYLDVSLGDTDLAQLEGEELTEATFRQQIQTLPFLAKSRLVIIRDLILKGKKEIQEAVQAELKKVPKTTVLIFYEAGTPDKRTKLFQALNQPKQAQVFESLKGPEQARYIETLLKKHDLKLDRPAFELLIKQIGNDLWLTDQEIQKLALYQKANQLPSLGIEQINELVSPLPDATPFALLDAFGNRQSQAALERLQQIPEDEAGFGTLGLIANHFRTLLLIANGQTQGTPKNQLATSLKLHPFVFDKAFQQVRRYTYEELTACYRFLFQVDLAAKQSMIEPLIGLSVLAAALGQKKLHLPDLLEENMLL